jgi:hypothetical protein
MEKLKTQQEVDDHIERHKVELKSFEKSFGYKKMTITLPTFMWDRILGELLTSSVFSDRLYIDDHDTYGIDKDQVEWDTELIMGIELLKKKLNK